MKRQQEEERRIRKQLEAEEAAERERQAKLLEVLYSMSV